MSRRAAVSISRGVIQYLIPCASNSRPTDAASAPDVGSAQGWGIRTRSLGRRRRLKSPIGCGGAAAYRDPGKELVVLCKRILAAAGTGSAKLRGVHRLTEAIWRIAAMSTLRVSV